MKKPDCLRNKKRKAVDFLLNFLCVGDDDDDTDRQCCLHSFQRYGTCSRMKKKDRPDYRFKLVFLFQAPMT